MCQDNTGGVSGRYRSVECQCRSGGAMMCGVMRTQTHGHMTADDNNAWVQMSGHMNSMGWVTDTGGRLLGCRKCVEMGNLDVFSARCNSLSSYSHCAHHCPPPSSAFTCPHVQACIMTLLMLDTSVLAAHPSGIVLTHVAHSRDPTCTTL